MRLGIPLFGSHPDFAWLGTKQGSRQVFLEEDVPHPQGFEAADRRELERRAEGPARAARGREAERRGSAGSGMRRSTSTRLDAGLAEALELEDTEISVEEYLEAFDEQGGIVEELIEGDDFRSPSVQIRMSPAGQVDILSTHDQVLGGPHGQTYFGCHFPADQEYAARLAAEGLKVGRRLAREGVLGRAAVDFVAVRRRRRLAAERRRDQPSLRRHDASVLRAAGADRRRLRPARRRVPHPLGDVKHYAATDHLDSPAYRSLTPDDLLDVVAERGLGWDDERETGVALHMVSALAVAGRIGLTAIGEHARGGAGALLRSEGRAGRVAGSLASSPCRSRTWSRIVSSIRPEASTCSRASSRAPCALRAAIASRIARCCRSFCSYRWSMSSPAAQTTCVKKLRRALFASRSTNGASAAA